MPMPPPLSGAGTTAYLRRLRRIEAMYRFAAALPLTMRERVRERVAFRRAGPRRVALAFLRRRALRTPPARPLRFAAISFAAGVSWPHAAELKRLIASSPF